MPPGAYETLAGLVLARLGRIPDVGDDIVVDGWRLTVTRRDRHRVAELRLAQPDTVESEPAAEPNGSGPNGAVPSPASDVASHGGRKESTRG